MFHNLLRTKGKQDGPQSKPKGVSQPVAFGTREGKGNKGNSKASISKVGLLWIDSKGRMFAEPWLSSVGFLAVPQKAFCFQLPASLFWDTLYQVNLI